MDIQELCTRFTADLSDFNAKMKAYREGLVKASGVTSELGKEISKALISPVEQVRKLAKETSALADKQVKTAETMADMKHKLEDYKTLLASIQQKHKQQREDMQKLIDKFHKLTAVQKKQQEFLKETDGGIEGVRKARKDITDYIHDMSATYEDLKKKIESSSGASAFPHQTQRLKELERQIKLAKDEVIILDNELAELHIDPEKLNTSGFTTLNKEIEELRGKIGNLEHSELDLTAKEESLNSVMANTAVKIENLKDKLNAGSDALSEMKEKLKSVSDEAGKAGSKSQEFCKTFTVFGGGLKSVLGKLGSGIASVTKKGFSSLINRIKGASSSSNGLNSRLLNVTKSIKKIGIVALGLKVVKSVFGQLRSVVSNYLSSNEKLNEKVNALKDSFGKALAPAIEIVVGLFEKLMPYAISVANAISDLLSSLGITAALKSTSSALDGVTSSTKKLSEAQNDLYGFDQITKVSDNSSNDSSKSDNNASYSASKQLTEYLQKLKDLWNNSDFEGVGETIAGSLNKVLSKINSLDWNVIQNKVNNFVGGIAKSLNGFIKNFDWKGAADVLSNGINTVIGALNTAVSTIDWSNVGSSLATGINRLVEKIDWKGAAKVLSNGLNAIIESVGGFVSTFDAGGFGNGLADFLISGISSIKWDKAGKSIRDLITKLCDAISGFLEKLTTDSESSKTIANAIVDFIEGLDIPDITFKVLKVLLDLTKATVTLVKSLFDVIVERLCEKFGWTWDGEYVTLTGGMGISVPKINFNFGSDGDDENKKSFGDWIKEKWEKLKESLSGKNFFIPMSLSGGVSSETEYTVSLKDEFSDKWKDIKSKWDSIKDKTATLTSDIKESAKNALSNLKDKWDSLKSKTVILTNTVKESTKNALANLKTKYDSLKSKAIVLTNEVKEKAKNALSNLKTKYDSLKSKTVTLTNSVKESTKNALTNLKSKYDSLKSKTITLTNSVKESTKSAVANLKSKWDSLKTKTVTLTNKVSSSTALSNLKTKWDSIKNKTATVTAEVKDKASTVFKNIANSFIDFVNKAIDKINSKLKISVGTTLSNILNAIGVKVSNGSYQLFSIPKIPYLEAGGIVSKPTVAMVGEHGKEAVMPLENNTGWITQLAHTIVSIMGSPKEGAQGPIIIPIYIGGKHITDVVIDDINKRTKATGNCPIKI